MSFVMSAGLVQVETSLAHADDRDGDRFVLVQECFRHFDLDRVGSNDVHLSIFEMPGAFVFGPNGKADTIKRMWTLATSVLGIDKSRLWVSYFKGGKVLQEDLPGDETTRQAWIDTGAPEERIVGLGAEDNYWVQGGGINGRQAPRKAGPNTELFFDRGAELACGPDCKPGCRCGRFIEFSNSLFICREQNRDNGTLRPMAEPFAETVIGAERVAMILQETPTIFDIADYEPIVKAIDDFVYAPNVTEPLITESERVIADHLKALYVLVADGAPAPGKNGRERIIKLLIRGVVTRKILLGIQSQKFPSMVIDCISQAVHRSVQASPEARNRMITYFSDESERFLETIERGRRQLERFLEENDGHTLSGSQILFLEKRKGLPHLLTAMMLQKRGLVFADAEYRDALEVWKKQPHN
jgi:alanyl-tRNA synthetase